MDSFINKLTEEFAIKLADYTVFDIANPSDGLYYTNKISYQTLLSQLSGDIFKRLKALIDSLQSNLNSANANIARKLDKQGLTFSPTERMTGPLVVNSTLCATGISYFSNLVNVNNNFISNLKDPVLDQDAVNLRTLSSAIAALVIPNGGDYIRKSGDIMTAGFITAASDFPTADRHLATKIYVDQEVGAVNTRINGLDFVKRSGDTMTGSLFLTGAPQTNNEASNKKYVDDKFASIVIPTTVEFIKRSGDTMTGSLFLTGAPQTNNEASNKKYVDDKFGGIVIPDVSVYILKSGDTMTGGNLTLSAEPFIPKHATTKKYVDEKFDSITANYATRIYVDTTFVKKSGDTMTGTLMLTGDPFKPNEAANKNYVDFKISTLAAGFATVIYVDSTFLKKTGDTMTAGNLTLSAEPSVPKHATTKKYVDDEIDKVEVKIDNLNNTYIKKSGDTMTGNLNIKGFTEAYGVIASSHGATVTLNTSVNGNTYYINLGTDITSFDVTGVDETKAITITLFIKSNTTNTVSWNFKVNGGIASTAKWGGPDAPIISKDASTDVYTFTRVNNIWFGFVGGQGFN